MLFTVTIMQCNCFYKRRQLLGSEEQKSKIAKSSSLLPSPQTCMPPNLHRQVSRDLARWRGFFVLFFKKQAVFPKCPSPHKDRGLIFCDPRKNHQSPHMGNQSVARQLPCTLFLFFKYAQKWGERSVMEGQIREESSFNGPTANFKLFAAFPISTMDIYLHLMDSRGTYNQSFQVELRTFLQGVECLQTFLVDTMLRTQVSEKMNEGVAF